MGKALDVGVVLAVRHGTGRQTKGGGDPRNTGVRPHDGARWTKGRRTGRELEGRDLAGSSPTLVLKVVETVAAGVEVAIDPVAVVVDDDRPTGRTDHTGASLLGGGIEWVTEAVTLGWKALPREMVDEIA